MSFDLQRMLESKRAFRQRLAARPLVEKLRLLDELHKRALVIRRASTSTSTISRVDEAPGRYDAGKGNH